jgi:hypothetical protein
MTPPKEAKFSNLTPIFTRSCNFSACHERANPAYGNLKLTAPDAYCALTGQMGGATYRMAAQGDFPRRVVSGDRQKSFLYKKLILTKDESGPMKPLGSRMPYLGEMLDAAEIDLFGRWIDAGAKDDSPTAGPCM